MFSTAPAEWATGHSLEMSYPSAEMPLLFSTVIADHDINENVISTSRCYNGVMVIVVGNGHDQKSSNPFRGSLYLNRAKSLGKGINSTVFSSTI